MNLGSLLDKVKDSGAAALERLRQGPEFVQEKIEWLREDKRRLIAAAGALAAAVLVLAVVVTLAARPSKKAAGDVSLKDVFPDAVIESGDMFLPAEPDYVPALIPERERRESWTEADAGDFWYDPLEKDGETWMRRLGEGVDELLERVP